MNQDNFSIGRLNHVAIAVPNLEASAEQYRLAFGANVSEPLHQPEHGVTVVFITLPNSKIELLHPLGDASPIANFLKNNVNGGIHHICYEVANVSKSAEVLIGKGYRVLGDGKPKIGAHGNPVIFLHPKDFNGCLIELEEVS